MEIKNEVTERPMDVIGTGITASIKEENLS